VEKITTYEEEGILYIYMVGFIGGGEEEEER
jgi:hypothetical protein